MIHVVAGQLADQAVDAVVRPADATLNPVGALALRLDEAGGIGLAEQRRTVTPLEAGAAVVTGGGALAAGYVLHVVVVDERGPAGPDRIRRALVSAWQRADDWGLARIAAPLVGVAGGTLTMEAATRLLAETLPRGGGPAGGPELTIVVEAAADRDAVEAFVRRMT